MKITMKAARVNANLTQIEAAKKLGISESTIINWENGKTAPKANKIPLICDVYNCEPHNITFLTSK